MDFTSVPANGPFPLFVLDLVEDATLLVCVGGTLKLRRVSRESVEYLRQFFLFIFFKKRFLYNFSCLLSKMYSTLSAL